MLGVQLDNLPAARPGTVLCGKYRVERVLARGGMGTVVVATHLKLDRLVAIKLVDLEGRDRAHVSARFLREARAAGRLVGDHVVRIIDLDEAADGTPFLVMELLEGTDLERLLTEQGRVAPQRAVDWALQACAALAEAHARDVVHRDVKPANLFLVRRLDGVELIKLLDFGISKIVTDEVQLTRTAATLGSPLFMSPEQLLTPNVVDRRSDVWSLGVTLYRWLAGVAPFDAADASALAAQIAAQPPRPLGEVAPQLPEGLATVVMRCLEKDAARRFSSVLELADALEPFRAPAGLGSAARVRLADAAARVEPPAAAVAPAPAAAPAPSWTLSHDVPRPGVSGGSAVVSAGPSSGSTAGRASAERPDGPSTGMADPRRVASGERLDAAGSPTGERPKTVWLRPVLVAGALAIAGAVVIVATSSPERPAPRPAVVPPDSTQVTSPAPRPQPEVTGLPEAPSPARDAGSLARVRAPRLPADPRDPADLELK